MTLSLPQEMLEKIIAHLQDEKKSLKHCALVSRRWVYPCQSHLFHSLSVDFDRANSNQKDPSSSPIYQLRRILLHSPSLGNHVRSFTVEVDSQESLTGRQQLDLAAILPYFPRLSKFELSGFADIEFSCVEQPLFDALRNTLASPFLTSISLSDWKFDDLNHFVRLMGTQLRPLDSLVLDAMSLQRVADALQHEPSSNSTIVTIQHLDVQCSSDFGGWLTTLGPVAVKKASLDFYSGDDGSPFVQLLSPSLEEMVLLMERSSFVPDLFDLGSFTKLRSLSIILDDPEMIELFEDILPNNVIENINIRVSDASRLHSDPASYRTLSQRLASIHLFPSLEMVKIIISEGSFAAIDLKLISRRMRSLVDRGVLSVETPVGEVLDSNQIRIRIRIPMDEGYGVEDSDNSDDTDESVATGGTDEESDQTDGMEGEEEDTDESGSASDVAPSNSEA